MKTNKNIRKFIKFLRNKPTLYNLIVKTGFSLYLVRRFFNKNIDNKIFHYNINSEFPAVVHPENINICNADCVMCVYGKMTRKKGLMDEKLYKKIVDECAKHKELKELWLYMFGEPLLDPNLAKKIKYAKKKRIPVVYLATNASLLNEKKSKEIFESGLDKIGISLDGATKETYEKLRRNLKFDVVTKNVTNFLKYKKQKNYKKPEVWLRIIEMDKTKKEIKPFIKKWKKLADVTAIDRYHNWGGDNEFNKLKKSSNLKRLPCKYLWNKCVVHINGDVPLCCLDSNCTIKLGNVNEKSIFDIWNDKKIKEIRELHIKGEFDKIPLCRDCSKYIDDDYEARASWFIR